MKIYARLFVVMLFIVSCAVFLTGCQAIKRPEELAFQGLQVMDYRQTSEISAKPDQYYEARAAWAIGEHPSQRSVNAYFIGESLVHLGVSELLIRADMPKVYKTWQFVTIGAKADNVRLNYSIGLKVKF